MKKKQRDFLHELCGICNKLGGGLDRTSTHESKLWDRQQAHMDVYHVLYGVLVDHPDNEQRNFDWDRAFHALSRLRALTQKEYPDRTGTYLQPSKPKEEA